MLKARVGSEKGQGQAPEGEEDLIRQIARELEAFHGIGDLEQGCYKTFPGREVGGYC